jgi:hypothetical protein
MAKQTDQKINQEEQGFEMTVLYLGVIRKLRK